MTYYSDLLIVLDELEALQFGKHPNRPAEELRQLCLSMLEIDPEEELARQLFAELEALPPEINRKGLVTFLREKALLLLRGS
jgi:hypothetical protein